MLAVCSHVEDDHSLDIISTKDLSTIKNFPTKLGHFHTFCKVGSL